jgi:hypothetical protein
MPLAAQYRTAFSSLTTIRHFHTSMSIWNGDKRKKKKSNEHRVKPINADDLANFFRQPRYPTHESTSAGHLMMRQHRQLLQYLRLIEHEVPSLVGS